MGFFPHLLRIGQQQQLQQQQCLFYVSHSWIRPHTKFIPVAFTFVLALGFFYPSMLKFQFQFQPLARSHRKFTSSAHLTASLSQLEVQLPCEEEEQENATEGRANKDWRQRAKDVLSDESILQRTVDCEKYFTKVNTVAFDKVTEEEKAFPLAFGHSVHHQVGILEAFLAVTFRPGVDSHCIHVDPKAPEMVHKAVHNLVSCYQMAFPNCTLFVARRPVATFWGHISVLEADLKCLRQLSEADADWRMFLNPAASELPLLPIGLIRQRLSRATGRNGVIDGFQTPKGNEFRWKRGTVLERTGPGEFDLKLNSTHYAKEDPPLVIRKGSKNVALRRNFTEFILKNPIAIKLYNFLQDAYVPDEHFYSTLDSLTTTPTNTATPTNASSAAHFVQLNETAMASLAPASQRPCVRQSWWYSAQAKCTGAVRNAICQFGLRDLPVLRNTSDCLMANKFNVDVDARAVVCQAKYVREWHAGK